MHHREATFTGHGGLEIAWQAWRPEAPARAILVVSHGAGEHGGRYGHVVDALVPLGFAVYASDHRGHGRSGGRRALVDRFAHAVADLRTVIGIARGERPDVPLFLLGHSMGGAIALTYAVEHQDDLGGLVLSGAVPALDAASSAFLRAFSGTVSALAPRLPVVSVDPAAVSRDPREVEMYRNDPLVHHGRLPARTAGELVAAAAALPERAGSLTLPLLVLNGEDDVLAPVAGSRMVADRARSTDLTLHTYPGLRHEVFNELPADRARVLDDLAAWLTART
jgi:lysophospholipase